LSEINNKNVYWTCGTDVASPKAGDVIHVFNVPVGCRMHILGHHFDCSDLVGNRLVIRWKHRGVEYMHPVTLTSNGTIHDEGASISGMYPADPASQILVVVANDASVDSVYNAKLLVREEAIR
jgi:hypothetical protein